MTDAELIAEVIAVRSGILSGRASDGLCATVCLPLRTYLAATLGIEADVVEGEIHIDGVGWADHVWLRLPDGRVLDPTIDQFNGALGRALPAVYIGAADPDVHRQLAVLP